MTRVKGAPDQNTVNDMGDFIRVKETWLGFDTESVKGTGTDGLETSDVN